MVAEYEFLLKIGIVVVVFLAAYVINKIAKKVFGLIAKKWSAHLIKLAETCVAIIVYIGAIIALISILELGSVFESLLVSAGVGAVVIGFAAKDSVANIIAGVFVFRDKPFEIGDLIEIKGNLGYVTDITLRYIRLKTFENKQVTIPTSMISQEIVIDYTTHKRKVILPIGISYESDLDKAKKIMAKAAIDHPVITEDPEVFVSGYGKNSVDLELRAMLDDPFKEIKTKSDLFEMIKKGFEKHGIEIPYPHRVVVDGKGKK